MLAGRFMGRGDKEGADQAAVNAMRLVLSTVDMNGIIVIGEGEKDKAPMLFNGEKVGTVQNQTWMLRWTQLTGLALWHSAAQTRWRWWLSRRVVRCLTRPIPLHE